MELGAGVEGLVGATELDVAAAVLDVDCVVGPMELVLDCGVAEEAESVVLDVVETGPVVAEAEELDAVETESVVLEDGPDGVTEDLSVAVLPEWVLPADDFVALLDDSVLTVTDVDCELVDTVLDGVFLVVEIEPVLPLLVLAGVDTEVMSVVTIAVAVELCVDTVVELVVVVGQDCAEIIGMYIAHELTCLLRTKFIFSA